MKEVIVYHKDGATNRLYTDMNQNELLGMLNECSFIPMIRIMKKVKGSLTDKKEVILLNVSDVSMIKYP